MVGGWLVQPVIKEVWNGEFQLFFIAEKCTHSNRKIYHRGSADEVLPSQDRREIVEYQPTNEEVRFGRRLKAFWEEELGLPTDIFRVDFLKGGGGEPIVLELENVNPGFFIRYVTHERRLNIAADFEQFLRRRVLAAAQSRREET